MVDPNQIIEMVRSAYEISEAFFARQGKRMAVETELMREALASGQRVDMQQIKMQAGKILHEEAKESMPIYRSVVSALSQKYDKEPDPQKELSTLEKIGQATGVGMRLLSVAAVVGIVLRTSAEITETINKPSAAGGAILAMMPPPVIMAMYAIEGTVGLYKLARETFQMAQQQIKISFGDLEPEQKKEAIQLRNKALMNMAQAAFSITLAAVMISASVMAPGATNVLGLSIMAAAMTLSIGRMVFGVVNGMKAAAEDKQIVSPSEKSHDLSAQLKNTSKIQHQHEEKKEYSENFIKNIIPYIGLRMQVALSPVMPAAPASPEAKAEQQPLLTPPKPEISMTENPLRAKPQPQMMVEQHKQAHVEAPLRKNESLSESARQTLVDDHAKKSSLRNK